MNAINPTVLADLTHAIGGEDFARRLFGASRQLGDVVELFGYRVTTGLRIEAIASCGVHDDAQTRVVAYGRSFHQYDVVMLEGRDQPNSGFARRVAAGDIAHSDYRAVCFEHPRFADKLTFGWRRETDTFVISFYRRHAGDDAETARLASLANSALAMLILGHTRAAERAAPADHRLRAAIAKAYPDLSAREQQVCLAMLLGASAERTAFDLGISAASVLTYRQRAYAKTGATSAVGLLHRLLG